jgi:hypothetical protein
MKAEIKKTTGKPRILPGGENRKITNEPDPGGSDLLERIKEVEGGKTPKKPSSPPTPGLLNPVTLGRDESFI